MIGTAAIEKRLRLLFDSCDVRFGELKGAAACTTMDSGRTVVTLARGHDDYFTLMALLHELMHKAMPGELAAFGAWEEPIIVRVAEPLLMEWIVDRPARHAWWLKRISTLRGK